MLVLGFAWRRHARGSAQWVQESIIGGSFRWLNRAGVIAPTIVGTAFITAEAALILDERDPFCWGFR